MNNYYVYCHQRASDGECFYIGKGKDDRAYQKRNRNQCWYNTVAKYGYNVVILINNLTKEQALEYKTWLIKTLGREY